MVVPHCSRSGSVSAGAAVEVRSQPRCRRSSYSCLRRPRAHLTAVIAGAFSSGRAFLGKACGGTGAYIEVENWLAMKQEGWAALELHSNSSGVTEVWRNAEGWR